MGTLLGGYTQLSFDNGAFGESRAGIIMTMTIRPWRESRRKKRCLGRGGLAAAGCSGWRFRAVLNIHASKIPAAVDMNFATVLLTIST